MENWLRTYIMSFGPGGGGGKQIGNTESPEQDALRISFSAEKGNGESENTANIKVWNLSPASIGLLKQKDCTVELKAGYGGNNALVITGGVTTVTTTTDEADRMTEIEVADGQIAMRDSVITLSFNSPVNSKDLYNKAAGACGLSIVFGSGLSFKTLKKFAYVGTVKAVLQKITEANKHVWSIQNGVIQITNPGAPVKPQAYVLSKDTGLIEVPTAVSLSKESKDGKKREGYQVKYFLNAAINVNDVVHIDSKAVSGDFLVEKVTLEGDNYSGDWLCTAEVSAM